MISSEMTVREVAMQVPQSTRLFETLQIDYCCGGNRPLTQACATAGVEVDNVMQQLSALEKSSDTATLDFQNLSLKELITHILETHHVFTKSEIDRIQALSTKVIGVHGVNHPELLTVGELVQRLCTDLAPHMFKEEQVLFPYIEKMEQAELKNQPVPFAPFGTVKNPIRMMMMEHDTAGDILRKLRAVTADYQVPPDGCISFQTLYQALEGLEKDLHQHIHLENNILFPKAAELESR
ncbi:MAG TPA: iron-sulfur cluster repair di-iron protein [Pyrinomonadaceae bacterium]|nr:iron-sulfur cluster repair di-iron protein [Pyrinomonadaceae bacterium]